VTTTTMHSKRQYPRHGVRTPCVVMTEDNLTLLGDETMDLSWDGARIRCHVPAKVGDKIRIRLQLPKSAVWVDAEGYVARVMPGRRRGEDPASLGLKLNKMDGMMRVLLASTIRGRPEPEATRRGPRRDYAEAVQRIQTAC
jgi:hypothetical protein